MSEKSELPSAKKLRDARKQGQFARSRLLSSAMVTAGGLFGFLAFADETSARLKAWTTALFTEASRSPVAALYEALAILALAAAPALGGAMLAALVVSVASAGLQLNVDQVEPKLERLDAIAGFKRLFSLKQALEIGKGLLAAAILAAIVWGAVEDGAGTALKAISVDGVSAFGALFSVLVPTMKRALVVLLILGLADYALARRTHLRELMMSKEDLKQEHKQSEGDPHQKSKRKALHRQLSAGGAARGVQKASAVVVNPTHIAVALRFDEQECDAPYIVAKGQEEDALKLKKEAKELGIPVVRDIPLARSLIQFEVGEEVPEELYQAAAAVLKVALEKKDHPEGETP